MAEQAQTVEERIGALLEAEENPQPEAQEAPPEAQEAPPEEVKAEPEGQEETPEKAEEAEEVSISTLHELAQEVGVDVADLYNLKVPINTADGRKEITLGEWKDSVQSAETVNTQKAELAEKQKQYEELLQNAAKRAHEQAQQNAVFLQMAEADLARDYQAVNWDELRMTDPAEWSAKQTEFNQRNQQIQQAKYQAQVQVEQGLEAQRQMLAQKLPEEEANLSKLIPSWTDKGVAEVERQEVAKYLVESGYTPEEISNVYKSRDVAIAYKAMQFDKLKASKPAAKRVVKIGSKPIKPGKSQSKADQRSSQSADQRARLKKSGDYRDMAALLNSDEFLGDM